MGLLRLLIIISCVTLFVSCSNKNNKRLKSEAFLKEQGRGAVLKANPQIIDFKEAKASAKNILYLSSTITNTGTEPLILYKADVSCGCISVSIDKKPLQPGESTKIKIRIKTEGNKGVFDKAVFIQSNAENNPEIIRTKGVLTE